MIGDYLDELGRELRRRRAPAARLLREVEDHLRESAAELHSSGLTHEQAESQAVVRFGAAATVAARFAQATASATAQRAVNASTLAVAGYAAVLFGFATGSQLLRDFPQGAPSFFAFQLAAVALVVALVRSWRWRGQVVAQSELVAIARAVAVAIGALVVAAVSEAAVALSRPAGVIAWSEARYLTLAFAAAFVVVIAAAFSAVRASAQAAAVATLPTRATSAESLLDALDALTARPLLRRLVRPPARTMLRHPWPATLLVASAAFVAVTAVGLAGDRESLAAAAAAGGLEATVIVAAFAAFGRLLGLRPSAA
jgi:hypothetical protein